MCKIAVDLHFSNLKEGLYTDMGSEGRWGTNWAKVLAESGHQVDCICSENVYGWGSSPPIPNVTLTNRVTENKYDIALLTGPSIPQGVNADLYMFMHFSPQTIESKDRKLYEHDNSVIVYPVEVQFRYPFMPPNRYENKTYYMPTPIAENMQHPDYNRLPSIAWTNRWGPGLTNDTKFNAFIKFARIHNLHTMIFSYQNFYHYVRENERDEGVKKIQEQVDLLQSVEKISSAPSNHLIEKLKITKFALNIHGGGLGGSMLEQVICGAFPLPCTGTNQLFSHIDTKLYNNPYPDTIDEIVKNWEIPLYDESFYISALKAYQKEVEPHIYSNALNLFSKIISKYGFKL